VVLDEMGADKLLGNGDMLYLSPGTSTMLRGQGTFLSDDEIARVVDFVGVDDPQFAGELMQLKTKDELEAAATGGKGDFQSRDDLYDAAVDIVIRERRGSCSLLQRALGIGYGRAARLIDFMAEDGVVGQYNGSQARDVLVSLEDWENRHNQPADAAMPAKPADAVSAAAGASAKPRAVVTPTERATFATIAPRRRNKIVPEPDEPSELEDEIDEDEYEEEEEAAEDDEDSDDADVEESDEDECETDEIADDEEDEEEESDDDEEEYDATDADAEWEDDDSDEDDDESEKEEELIERPPARTRR
jgi:S-DNA-T family DNA segregation ATPase FtsK/SpoIIIE